MFFSMYARGSLVILLLVTYILTDEPSNQKRVFSMYVQESLFILLLATYIHTDCIYVKSGHHTCMLSAFTGEHTYTATNLGPNIVNSRKR